MSSCATTRGQEYVDVEDWQQWQIRADQIARDLGGQVDALERDAFAETGEAIPRGFWPRFRELKERVRTAPAIRLEDKLALERRLRSLGSRAYKAQEAIYGRSSERKNELLAAIAELRTSADGITSPRELRLLRRDLDRLREQFGGTQLVPADRQTVWDAWSETNQGTWSRLSALWAENHDRLHAILGEARRQLDTGNPNGVRRAIGHFFEALKTHETKQDATAALRVEADELRRSAEDLEAQRAARLTAQVSGAPVAETWRAAVDRNREMIARLGDEVAQLERQYEGSDSLLDQAMVRGTLVDKRRKLAELERSTKALERRIEQTEESPVISPS